MPVRMFTASGMRAPWFNQQHRMVKAVTRQELGQIIFIEANLMWYADGKDKKIKPQKDSCRDHVQLYKIGLVIFLHILKIVQTSQLTDS